MDVFGLIFVEFFVFDVQLYLFLVEVSGNIVIVVMMVGFCFLIELYVQFGVVVIEDWEVMVVWFCVEYCVLVVVIDDVDVLVV